SRPATGARAPRGCARAARHRRLAGRLGAANRLRRAARRGRLSAGLLRPRRPLHAFAPAAAGQRAPLRSLHHGRGGRGARLGVAERRVGAVSTGLALLGALLIAASGLVAACAPSSTPERADRLGASAVGAGAALAALAALRALALGGDELAGGALALDA